MFYSVVRLSLILFVLALFSPFTQAQKSDIKVEKLSRSTLEKLIKERNNKPLFINVWATWCVPCREEFPDLVRLAGNYKDKADFIGISVDYDDEINSKIIPFLKNFNVNFPQYVNSFEDAQELINFFDKDWNGAIPATFMYDRSGKKAVSIIGKEDYNTFQSKLSQVISKQ